MPRGGVLLTGDRIPPPVLVDAHVHVHACFDTQPFLDAAAANFRAAAMRLGLAADTVGCLLLADPDHSRPSIADRPPAPGSAWSLAAAAEPGTVLASRGGTLRLILMSGRQITTTDGLELLALLCDAPLTGRYTLPEAIVAAQTANAVPVIPWGFGKWTGRRGAIVEAAVRDQPCPLFLGDNGGRPRLLPPHRLLRRARRHRLLVLPGSDPLPFLQQQDRAGSCGFVADTGLSMDSPAADLRRWILGLETQPPVFRRPGGFFAFALNQLRMQVRKLGGMLRHG